jgi:hypothetical protein
MPEIGLPWFDSVRLDGQCAVASNRMYMSIQRLKTVAPAVFHLVHDAELIRVAATESKFNSNLHITVDPVLKWATVTTSLGYKHPSNGGIWSDIPNDMDRWRSIVPTGKSVASGGLYLDVALLQTLVESSPSGKVVLQQNVNVNESCLMRDTLDPDWFGLFYPRPADGALNGAIVPNWWKA